MTAMTAILRTGERVKRGEQVFEATEPPGARPAWCLAGPESISLFITPSKFKTASDSTHQSPKSYAFLAILMV